MFCRELMRVDIRTASIRLPLPKGIPSGNQIIPNCPTAGGGTGNNGPTRCTNWADHLGRTESSPCRYDRRAFHQHCRPGCRSAQRPRRLPSRCEGARRRADQCQPHNLRFAWTRNHSSHQLHAIPRTTGEALVRIYMHEMAPQIRPAAVERPLRGVISSVRIRAQLDLMDEDGTIIDIRTAQAASARVDPMQRFEWTTCARLAEGSSGVVRSDILVTGSTPQLITQTWAVSAADVQWTDALYPLAQEAMRRGYYMPNRNSIHCSRHHCPCWR